MAGGSTDLFVPELVERFLDAHGIGEGPVSYRPLGDGHSNLTYLVERVGARVVLRRPPRPPLPPSAHDMLRESAIQFWTVCLSASREPNASRCRA